MQVVHIYDDFSWVICGGVCLWTDAGAWYLLVILHDGFIEEVVDCLFDVL